MFNCDKQCPSWHWELLVITGDFFKVLLLFLFCVQSVAFHHQGHPYFYPVVIDGIKTDDLELVRQIADSDDPRGIAPQML